MRGPRSCARAGSVPRMRRPRRTRASVIPASIGSTRRVAPSATRAGNASRPGWRSGCRTRASRSSISPRRRCSPPRPCSRWRWASAPTARSSASRTDCSSTRSPIPTAIGSWRSRRWVASVSLSARRASPSTRRAIHRPRCCGRGRSAADPSSRSPASNRCSCRSCRMASRIPLVTRSRRRICSTSWACAPRSGEDSASTKRRRPTSTSR